MNADDQLSAVQSWMQQALIRGVDPTEKDAIAQYVEPSQQLTAGQRLAIYQRGYYARLVQCLEGQYKALCHALGADLFRDFAKEYLLQFPSGSPTLAVLGAQFPEFLEASRPDKDAPVRETWIDFMVQLGRYEWDLYTVFDAQGNEGKPYATAEAPHQHLRLQSCLFVHQYDFPVHRFYSAVAREEDPEIPEPQTVWVAIVRTDFVTRVFPLLEPQYVFLQALKTGHSVAKSLAATAALFDTPPAQAETAWSEWREHWIAAGFFTGA